MIKKKLTEDTVEQAINDADTKEEKQEIAKTGEELDEPLVSDSTGKIELELDRALRINRRNHRNGNRNFQNILFIGEAGSGKTARINAWARANNINLVTVKAGELDDTDTGGVIAGNIATQVAVRLASTEFDQLDSTDSVLFLDEWNRAPSTVRQSLLTLIQNHTVTDPRVPGRMRYLKNFLFTVAAINPDDGDYDVQRLDQAELGRVSRKFVSSDTSNWVKYSVEYYTKLANRATDPEDKKVYLKEANLAKAIGSYKDFKFDDVDSKLDSQKDEEWNGLLLTPRNLTNAIEESEGDKEAFLSVYNDHCNNLHKHTMELALKDYKDIDDKANDALKGYEPKDDPMMKSKKDIDLDTIKNLKKSISDKGIFGNIN